MVVVRDDSLRDLLVEIPGADARAVLASPDPPHAVRMLSHRPVPALLLIDTCGIRLQEALAIRAALGAQCHVITLDRVPDPPVETALCPVAWLPVPFDLNALLAVVAQYCPN